MTEWKVKERINVTRIKKVTMGNLTNNSSVNRIEEHPHSIGNTGSRIPLFYIDIH